MMYLLEYSLEGNSALQSRLCPSLAGLIMQVKTDFENKVFKHIDQIVSVTYTADKVEKCALIAVLQQLKFCASKELKDEINFKLDYLMNVV